MSLLDWIYPPKCVACRIIFDPVHNKPRPWLCDNCRPLLEPVPTPICPRCGHPILVECSDNCLSCQSKIFYFKSHRACFIYNDVIRDMIHNIKFRSERNIAQGLGHLLSEAFLSFGYGFGHSEPFDYILPVPLHPSKKRSRGFNQATILSQPLSKAQNIPISENMVKRIKFTQPQSGLSVPAREQNLSDALIYSGSKCSAADKRILIIDDIFTSGATMNACAKLLMEQNAREVYCLSLSIALRDSDAHNSAKF